ncbi:hypothetical protein DYBT9623_01273 [Dyadobacter sp. CECT 9623]|uniref:Glycosyltransferase 2-like domain-containing protein n=1 Tax=Dyadobacter linearis TaxID=2823330 RepID=A0ABM8UMC9_9BACT|nr:glycosyltransferase [Dyadobacter sp. CECT 9623]CAG5068542.1 hypothetical protein DYBT9623_01273 [Dyadobacter sp. CECT 9623]
MKSDQKLAIVIPAFKSEYLFDTLESIRNQTCKDFTVYIGDDGSPNNLFKIIKDFTYDLDIVYKRFEHNMGAQNLVGHWERSVAMTNNEEWIWLFSDDDVMDPNCVSSFYKSLNSGVKADLFHFDIDIIDGESKTIKKCSNYPAVLRVENFFAERIRHKIHSSVVEYIFRRSVYYREDGFQNYDLAWCSDDATWIKFGRKSDIVTIPYARVSWRFSGSNISSNLKQKSVVLRKLESNVQHIQWVADYFKANNISEETSNLDKFKWAFSVVILSTAVSVRERYQLGLSVVNTLGYSRIAPLAMAYLMYWDVKRSILPSR